MNLQEIDKQAKELLVTNLNTFLENNRGNKLSPEMVQGLFSIISPQMTDFIKGIVTGLGEVKKD